MSSYEPSPNQNVVILHCEKEISPLYWPEGATFRLHSELNNSIVQHLNFQILCQQQTDPPGS